MHTPPLGSELKTMIGAGEQIALACSHAERHAAMGTEIVGDDNAASAPIEDQRRIQQRHAERRAVGQFA